MRPVPLVAVPRVYIFAAASLGQKLIIANQDNPPSPRSKDTRLVRIHAEQKFVGVIFGAKKQRKGYLQHSCNNSNN